MTAKADNFDRGVSLSPALERHGSAKAVVTVVLLVGIAAAALFWFLRPAAIEVVHPHVGQAVTAVYASGTVESTVMFPVAPRVGARLIAIDRDEHSNVHKGELLGRLEAVDLASNIKQLEAQAAFAEADYGRYARLMRENATTQQAFDHALATWKAAVAAVREARSQAGYMNLQAPGDCTVIARDGEVGQFIAANIPVFWLSCHAALRVSAQVDEEDVPLVKPGQNVLIRADAFPGRSFEGRVIEVTPKGDPIGRSYRVRIGLPPDCPLQIGMTTEANIIVRNNPHALLVPASALTGDRVLKVANGHITRTPVTLGAKGNDWIEILGGVSSAELILRDAAAAPADGKAPRLHVANP